MAVLLLFNDHDRMTTAEVMQATAMGQKEADRTLHSLVTCHLLKPAEPEAYDKAASLGTTCYDHVSSRSLTALTAPEACFDLNLRYNSKKKKVKISAAVAKDTAAESTQTHKSVSDDRKMFLQASTSIAPPSASLRACLTQTLHAGNDGPGDENAQNLELQHSDQGWVWVACFSFYAVS